MTAGSRAVVMALALAGLLAGVSPRSARAGDDSSGPADVDEPALTQVEARVGYGLAFGGGPGQSVTRTSPVTMTALVDHAVVEEPWTSLYGGVVVEGGGRGAAGAMIGMRIRPGRGWLRIAGAAVAMVVPATLYGPVASIGGCYAVGGPIAVCLDLESALFIGGSDLPDQRVAGQTQLVLGAAFDAW